MRVEIITVGGEILSGLVSDTNRTYLSRELTEIGAEVCWHSTVGDRVADLVEAVRTALERADLVVVTGGLGSTPDDITRRAIARVLDRELVLSDRVLKHLKERVEGLGRRLSPTMETQALIPRGASVYFNPVGTAPAFAADCGNARIWVLPGVPGEVKAITREHLLRELRARIGEQRCAWVVVRTMGISGVTIAERVAGLARGGITISYLPQRCGVDVRVAARGASSGEAQRKLESCKAEILSRLGDAVYCEGNSTLQQVVHGIILAKGIGVAVAESCTGGMLAFMLMSEPGSSAYFERGVVAYSDRAKRELLGVPAAVIESHGAVSRQTAEAMAQGIKESAGVELAVSTTGIAGPGGERPGKPVGLVYVGLATDSGVRCWEHRFMGTRQEIIHRACCAALDAIRRHLQEAQ